MPELKLTDADRTALRKSPLFAGMANEEIAAMMHCLEARVEAFSRGEYLMRQGDAVSCIGVVLSGSLLVGTQDYWGNDNIISGVEAGGMFGEAFACMPGTASTVQVRASATSRVAFFDVGRIITTCSSSCGFHTRLIRNLLTILARKNLGLTQKVEHISKRCTREKILSYLYARSVEVGSSEFDIPFNRQQLADYLAVERSAMSSCLSKMQDEGLISYTKSHFVLH